jgi:hypothetical protein
MIELAELCEKATGEQQRHALFSVYETLAEAGALTYDQATHFMRLVGADAPLDAAMTLVPEPEGYRRVRVDLGLGHENDDDPKCSAEMLWLANGEQKPRDVRGASMGYTLPLAICAAALRARAHSDGDGG